MICVAERRLMGIDSAVEIHLDREEQHMLFL